MLSYYQNWRGTPYRMGGGNKRGVDCSAFVQNAYQDVYRISLPRTTDAQEDQGRRVLRRNLREGDLVFFKTGWFRRHVGIYVGDQRFIHASPTAGVTQSSLKNGYWDKHYWKAKRVL